MRKTVRLFRDEYRIEPCTKSCTTPTPAQCHCAAECHRTYANITTFDQHRYEGRCLEALDFGWFPVNGVWGSGEYHANIKATVGRLKAGKK